jgi:hypothetical protein
MMAQAVGEFNQKMRDIFLEDILNNPNYYFTLESALHIVDLEPTAVCHLQRAIQCLYYAYNLKTLKHLVVGTGVNVRRIGTTKYELVCTLMHHYMHHGEGRRNIESDDHPVLTRVYMDFLERACIGNMSYSDNLVQLRLVVITHHINLQLQAIRTNHIQNLARQYEQVDNTRTGILNIHRYISGSLRQRGFENPRRANRRPRVVPRVRAAAAPNPVKYGFDSSFTSTEECPICYETTCDAYVDCKHTFCGKCIKQHVNTCNERRRTPICPMCRVNVKQVNSNDDSARPEVVDLTASVSA